MTLRDDQQIKSSALAGVRTASIARLMPFVAVAAGILLLLLAIYARTWRSFAVFHTLFCDFVDYYYPTGETVFRRGLPVEGFLYSPFNAILMAGFGLLGLNTALVLWGVLQIVSVSAYILLFRRLVPARPSIQLLFAALVVTSYPSVLNVIGGSVSFFMTAAILGLLVAYEHGHRAAGGGLLAFAVSFKFYPAIFFASFIARRDLRFLLFAAAACGVILFVIPAVLLGWGGALGFYRALFDQFRESDWVVANPHSQFFPHLFLRLLDPDGPVANPYLPLWRWIAYGIAAANMALVFLVQRARLRYADLWSFQILFMTIPFILKTSWAGDFVFLSFSQAFMAWWLLEGEQAVPEADTAGKHSQAVAWQGGRRARSATMPAILLVSIVFSNIAFFRVVGDYPYGFCGFIFWADLLLLINSYRVLLPPALQRLRGGSEPDLPARRSR